MAVELGDSAEVPLAGRREVEGVRVVVQDLVRAATAIDLPQAVRRRSLFSNEQGAAEDAEVRRLTECVQEREQLRGGVVGYRVGRAGRVELEQDRAEDRKVPIEEQGAVEGGEAAVHAGVAERDDLGDEAGGRREDKGFGKDLVQVALRVEEEQPGSVSSGGHRAMCGEIEIAVELDKSPEVIGPERISGRIDLDLAHRAGRVDLVQLAPADEIETAVVDGEVGADPTDAVNEMSLAVGDRVGDVVGAQAEQDLASRVRVGVEIEPVGELDEAAVLACETAVRTAGIDRDRGE